VDDTKINIISRKTSSGYYLDISWRELADFEINILTDENAIYSHTINGKQVKKYGNWDKLKK